MLERPTRHPLQTPRTCRFAHLGNHSEACEHSNLFVPTLTSTDQALRLRHCAEEMAGVMSLIAFRVTPMLSCKTVVGACHAYAQTCGFCANDATSLQIGRRPVLTTCAALQRLPATLALRTHAGKSQMHLPGDGRSRKRETDEIQRIPN